MNTHQIETRSAPPESILRQTIDILRRKVTETNLFPIVELKVRGPAVNNRARLVVNQHRAQLSFRIGFDDSQQLLTKLKASANYQEAGLHYLGHSQQFGDQVPAGIGLKVSDAIIISSGDVDLLVSLGKWGDQPNKLAEGLIAIDIPSDADLSHVEELLKFLSTELTSPLSIDWRDIFPNNRWEPARDNFTSQHLETQYGQIMVYHTLPRENEQLRSIIHNGLLSVDELICRGAPYIPGTNALNALENREDFDEYFDFYNGAALSVHARALLNNNESDEFNRFHEAQGPIIILKSTVLNRSDGVGFVHEQYKGASAQPIPEFFAALQETPNRSNELLFPIRVNINDIAAIVVESESRKKEVIDYLAVNRIDSIKVIVARSPRDVSKSLNTGGL